MNATRNIMALIEMLLDDGGELGVRELGARTGIPKSTAQRLLAQLEEGGWVVQDKRTHVYRVGAKLLCRAGGWVLHAALLEHSRDLIDGLARSCGRDAALSVLDGFEGLVLRVSQHAEMPQCRLFSLTQTAAGMALLTFAPAALRQYVLRGAPSSETLTAEIEEIRARGSVERRSRAELAVPLLSPEGYAVAALSLTPGRETEEAADPDVCLARLRSAAAKLAKRIEMA